MKSPNQTTSLCFASLVLSALFCAQSARAELTHRYSFSDAASSTTVKDSVGSANGTLFGGASLNGAGTLVLDGTDGYVDLPNGLISELTNATFEAWVTFTGNGGAWQRIFDFGDNSNGEDQQGTGRTYLFLSPRTGTGGPTRFAVTTDGGGGESPVLDAPTTLPSGARTHVAVSYDYSGKTARLFVNGKQVASGPVTIALSGVHDVNNWLGRSNWPDAFFNGEFHEFRIYDAALSPLDVALSALVGPDQVGGGDPGSLQSVALTVDAGMIKGDVQQVSVAAAFGRVSDVDVTMEPGTTYTSSSPSVLKVSATGSVQAVGVGTATVTALYNGKQDTKVVTVAPLPGLEPALKHRYSFTGDAAVTMATDSVGTAHGTLMGNAALTGAGSVELDGSNSYVDLPNGIISSLTNATFETWVTWTGASVWQRIFDFGSNSAGENNAGTGQTYLFLSPRNGGNNTLRFTATSSSGAGERPILNGTAALPVDRQSHIVVSYNVTEKLAKMYLNGRLISSGVVSISLKSIRDVNNWLGRSNWPDPYFAGRINEFRIYEGILSDQEVAFSTAAGPDVLGSDPGVFQSLKIDLPSPNLVVGGLPENGSILASFQNLANVNVTTFEGAKFETSNPAVATVSTNGVVDATGPGTATLKASYRGKEATLTLTVTSPADAPPAPKLIHRYSFSEAAGSKTIVDSVGGADGTLMGGGTFAGDGQLKLNGTDAYVDLPNGIISSLKNATFETWITWTGTRVWERIFDFGSNSAGEDAQGTGQTYIFVSPRGGPGTLRFAVTTNSGAGENPVLEGTAALTRNQQAHVVVSYNMSGGSVRFYLNGKRIAAAEATIPLFTLDDINNWLGRSNWPDPNFTGSFNEFRIYDGALLDAAVASNFAAGPDVVPGDAPTPPLMLTAVISAGKLTLNWPTAVSGFVLESADVLGPQAVWTPASETATTENGLSKVAIVPSQAARFFRLRK